MTEVPQQKDTVAVYMVKNDCQLKHIDTGPHLVALGYMHVRVGLLAEIMSACLTVEVTLKC